MSILILPSVSKGYRLIVDGREEISSSDFAFLHDCAVALIKHFFKTGD